MDWNRGGSTPLYWALDMGQSDCVDIIVQQTNVDFSAKTLYGQTVAQMAVRKGDVRSVESLAAQERCDCWNVPDYKGDTPVMEALRFGKTEIVGILVRCPRVDLICRDKEGWSLVFKAIQRKEIGM